MDQKVAKKKLARVVAVAVAVAITKHCNTSTAGQQQAGRTKARIASKDIELRLAAGSSKYICVCERLLRAAEKFCISLVVVIAL